MPLLLERREGLAHFQVVMRVFEQQEGACMDAAHAAIALARGSVTMCVELQASLDEAGGLLDLGTPEGALSASELIGRVLVVCDVEHAGAVRVAERKARVIFVLRCLGSPEDNKYAFDVNVAKAYGRSLLPHEVLQMHDFFEQLVTLALSPIFVGDLQQLLPVATDGRTM